MFSQDKTLKLVLLFSPGNRNTLFGTLKIGQNSPDIANLEFETHGLLEIHVFLPTEQAGTNIRHKF